MEIAKILAQKWVIPTATGVVGTACGFGAGYLLGKRNGGKNVQQNIYRMNVEDYNAVTQAEPVATPAAFSDENWEDDADIIEDPPMVVAEVSRVEDSEDEVIEILEAELVETETVNVFLNSSLNEWNEEFEASQRVEGQPYVIPVAVFVENELDYSQETLTYYSGDDILVDQQDKPIYNYSTLLGELKFGHGSGDPNVVYIRNDNIRYEWEVLFHTGQYSIEILGLEIESEYEEEDVKHSAERKFRSD